MNITIIEEEQNKNFFTNILGVIGTIMTTSIYTPQIYRSYKKKVVEISWLMLFLEMTSDIIWILYYYLNEIYYPIILTILNIPSIQMRYSTERPEVYEVGSSVKFDPTLVDQKFQDIHLMVDSLKNNKWSHPFGDGTSSKVIVEDLIDLSTNNKFHMHNKEDYDFDISRSFLQ